MPTDEIKPGSLLELSQKLELYGFKATYTKTLKGFVLTVKKMEPNERVLSIYNWNRKKQ